MLALFAKRLATVGIAAVALGFSMNGVAQEKPTVRINQAFQSLLYLPLYVAQEKGFFTQEGINVKISTGGGAAKSWSAVLGGSADFSLHDPVFIPISRAKGSDGVVVAGVQDAPAVWIVCQKAGDYQNDLDGFRGKSVVTMPEPDTTWAFYKYLMESNKYPNDFSKIVQVGVGNEMAPLLANRVDCANGTEPQISQVVGEGRHIVYSYAGNKDWYPYAFSSIVATGKYVDAHKDLTQKVVNAMQRASKYIYEDTEGAIEVAQKAFPQLKPEIVREAVKRELAIKAYPRDVLITKDAWAHAMRIADFVGIIDKDAETSSYDANVRSEFAKKAMETVQ